MHYKEYPGTSPGAVQKYIYFNHLETDIICKAYSVTTVGKCYVIFKSH